MKNRTDSFECGISRPERWPSIGFLPLIVLLLISKFTIAQEVEKTFGDHGIILTYDLTSPAQFQDVRDIDLSGVARLTAGNAKGSFASKPFNLPLRQETTFKMVSLILEGDLFNRDKLSIEIRNSGNGSEWSAWEPLSLDHHAYELGPNITTEPRYYYQDYDWIQFRFTLETDGFSAPPDLSGIKVSVFAPGIPSTSDPANEGESDTGDKNRSGNANCVKPPIRTRAQWGNQYPGTNSPSYTTVTHLIVHHQGQPGGPHPPGVNWDQVVQGVEYHHVVNNGWSDIGYNYLVDLNGVIYEGRAGGDNVVGAHFSCLNNNTMAVCVLDNYNNIAPTAASLQSLNEILGWKAEKEGIDVTTGSWHYVGYNLDHISGHRDVNATSNSNGCPSGTSCPGNNLYNLLPGIRTDVNSYIQNCNACPVMRSISGTISSGTYSASYSVASSGTIANGSNVTFEAGTTISMDAGFTVALGGIFHARIFACGPGPLKLSFDPAGDVEVGAAMTEPVQSMSRRSSSGSQVVSMYPNPSSGSVTLKVRLVDAAKVAVKLCDELGKPIQTLLEPVELSRGTHTFYYTVNDLASGIYYCEVRSDRFYEVQPLIVTD